MRILPLIVAIVVVPLSAISQDSVSHKKKWRFSPLPVVYYSPETRLGFGALVGVNFNLGDPALTTTSYLQSSFIYTLNKQYEWSNVGRIYAPDNNRITAYRIYYSYFPENFYGIQTETPKPFEEIIEYNRLWLEFRQFWKVAPFTYAGIFGKMNRLYNVESPLDGSLQTVQPYGYDGYTIAGFAPVFSIDSRSSQVYPRKGTFVELTIMYHPDGIGDYEFWNTRLDARWYKSVYLLSDDVIAVQFFVNLNNGRVPFRDMADIGGPTTMRGYYRGYYRYENMYALQFEYRFMINKYVGLVTWLGGALCTEKWYEPFHHSVKPNAGIGLRIRINQTDKLSLRADYGFGKDQSGLYFDASEAY